MPEGRESLNLSQNYFVSVLLAEGLARQLALQESQQKIATRPENTSIRSD
jgi:hypothetical protein